MASTDTPKAQKAHKVKDSSKKSSKKRPAAVEESASTDTATPSKRQRTEKTHKSTSSTAEATQTIIDFDAQDDSKANTSDTSHYTPSDVDLEKHTPFFQQTSSLYLPLSPVAHRFPLQGLCAEHLSPLLLTYYPPLSGVVLSYTNPRLSSTPYNIPATTPDPSTVSELPMAKSIDESAVSFIWLTADFTLLRPTPGSCIEGHISLQNESYLGLICYNFFNAAIDRRRLPKSWKWVGENGSSSAAASSNTLKDLATAGAPSAGAEWMRGGKARNESDGYFVDTQGQRVEGTLRFRVKDYESAPSTDRERGFLSIEGSLLTDAEDMKVDAEEKAKAKGKGKGRRLVNETARTNGAAGGQRPDPL